EGDAAGERMERYCGRRRIDRIRIARRGPFGGPEIDQVRRILRSELVRGRAVRHDDRAAMLVDTRDYPPCWNRHSPTLISARANSRRLDGDDCSAAGDFQSND